MTKTRADSLAWEVTRLHTETMRTVQCVTCGLRVSGRPDPEALAIAHVRETGHTVTVERLEIYGWTGLATVPAQSERAGTETPAGKEA